VSRLYRFSCSADHWLRCRIAAVNPASRGVCTLHHINRNDRPTTEFQGGISSQITEFEYTGRTLFVGFSARVTR